MKLLNNNNKKENKHNNSNKKENYTGYYNIPFSSRHNQKKKKIIK